jgi:hypothetical protein
MAGRKRVAPTIRLASKGQLWVLNRSGLLALRAAPDLEVVSVAMADAAIKQSMGRSAKEEVDDE